MAGAAPLKPGSRMGFWRVATSHDFRMLGLKMAILRENRRMRYVIDNPVVQVRYGTDHPIKDLHALFSVQFVRTYPLSRCTETATQPLTGCVAAFT